VRAVFRSYQREFKPSVTSITRQNAVEEPWPCGTDIGRTRSRVTFTCRSRPTRQESHMRAGGPILPTRSPPSATKSPAQRPGESQIRFRNRIANVQTRAILGVTRIQARKIPECSPIKWSILPFWHQNASHWHAAARPGWDAPVLITLLGDCRASSRNQRRFSQQYSAGADGCRSTTRRSGSHLPPEIHPRAVLGFNTGISFPGWTLRSRQCYVRHRP
jgi:hypothetical protein